MHATQEQIIDDTKIMHLNCDIGTAYKEIDVGNNSDITQRQF